MAFAKIAVLCVALSACASALSIPQHYSRSAHHRAVARAAASVPLNRHAAPVSKKRGREGCQSLSVPASAVASSPKLIASSSAIHTGEPTQPPKPKQENPTPVESPSVPASAPPSISSQPGSPQGSSAQPSLSSSEPPSQTSVEHTSAQTPSPSLKPAPPQTPAVYAAAPPASKQTPTSSPPDNGGGGSFMKGTQTGEGTYYHPALGACGITNSDSDPIVAVSHLVYDSYPSLSNSGYVPGGNPNNNGICGKYLNVNFEGRRVRVQVTDRCEGCALGDLDFSPSAFSAITGEADVAMGRGRVPGIKWTWE
ncbi:hypothetical protein BD779DRAFT_1464782 [Infundibulicybe gibba]|nr:hypothetical protein BD779DRAFT_1464782 [Infundibulicybe gibba]